MQTLGNQKIDFGDGTRRLLRIKNRFWSVAETLKLLIIVGIKWLWKLALFAAVAYGIYQGSCAFMAF